MVVYKHEYLKILYHWRSP